MHTLFLSLGSNIGDKENNLNKALELLKEKLKIIKVSSIYKSEPVDLTDQDWFFNLVIKGESELSAEDLLKFIQSIENKLGRKREIRFGPRIIDIDILFYDKKQINTSDLIIPHPSAYRRAFVLYPLLEIEPNFSYPKFPISWYMFILPFRRQGIEKI